MEKSVAWKKYTHTHTHTQTHTKREKIGLIKMNHVRLMREQSRYMPGQPLSEWLMLPNGSNHDLANYDNNNDNNNSNRCVGLVISMSFLLSHQSVYFTIHFLGIIPNCCISLSLSLIRSLEFFLQPIAITTTNECVQMQQ